MMGSTLLEIIRLSEKFLSDRGVERARREAEEVAADVLGMKRLDLYLQFDRSLSEGELDKMREAVKRRGNREPTAYIAGEVKFADLSIHISPDVLIPRPETEILVEKISQALMGEDLKGKVLWDVGCGSGCIGLSLKKRFPDLEVILSDVSARALAVAKQNSDGEVVFLEGDLFEPFSGKKCDFFVSNPPYISEEEYKALAPEVRDWEPKGALLAGRSGFEFYEKIARGLRKHLNKNGRGWLELGTGQGEVVKKMFEEAGFKCHYEQDWSQHDRFFFIENF